MYTQFNDALHFPGRRASSSWYFVLCLIGLSAALLILPAPAFAQPGTSADTQPADPAPPALNQSSEINIDARPFPRDFTQNGTEFSIYQPQYGSWQGNVLKGRFVMAVKTGTHTDKDGKTVDDMAYGVVWFTARSQVDKAARAVVLTDFDLTRVSFPTETSQQDHYLSLVKAQIPGSGTMTVSLDQLEAALAIGAVDNAGQSFEVDNTPPDIIFAASPSLLVLVQGKPVLRDTGHGAVKRIVNSRSLLLEHHGSYFTYFADHWARASSLQGPWAASDDIDRDLTESMQQAVSEKLVDTLANPPEELQKLFADGGFPEIYVRTSPAELITTQGTPAFADIPGTHLSYVENTGADVFVDTADDHEWYVLVSGRWFSAPGSKGPWSHVEADKLPPDFSKIPADNPKSGALASIPGTPEAQESLIANSIPQTATVSRSKATLTVDYDGAPQLAPINGTALQYVENTAVPVIQVPDGAYYAVDKGIWFTSAKTEGPWNVATSVPSEIYGIPSSSPLHYVTYVQVYGTDEDNVYVGYTPGYYGTVVNNNVVVYGTGYPCRPWIGSFWYGCPLTYGMGAYFGWNPWVGWTFGWGWGWYAGWYGAYSPWWGPWAGGLYRYGWWAGGAAAWNVYGHWGNNVVRGTAAAWANPWTGNYGRAGRGGYYNQVTGGRGAGRAGINTNIYTGTTRAGAQGVRYNPETGRASGGERTIAANPYSDRVGTQGSNTSVNTRDGQITQRTGAAGAGPGGAAGAEAFRTTGSSGTAEGIGGFHYNADTGALGHGGVANVNGNLYAGQDGNVYRHGDDGWSQVNGSGSSGNFGFQMGGLNNDRFANSRGDDRISGGFGGGGFGGDGFGGGGFRSGGFGGGGFSSGGFGGFRGGLGGFRGGGFRR